MPQKSYVRCVKEVVPMSAERELFFCVCVPVYKAEKYIRECIESVLNQSYQNFELILVDDGSPDNSGAICDEYAYSDKRIKVIHQKNKGLIAARDAAVHYIHVSCRSEDTYVTFLDSDDSLKQNALERLASIIRRENCDMVIFGMDRVSGGKKVIPFDKENTESYLERDKRRLYKKVFSYPEYNPVCRKAVRKGLIPEHSYEKFYGLSHGEDLLRSIELYKAASTIYFLQESLYNYTINPESITRTVGPDSYKVNFTIREQVHEFLEKERIFSESDWEEYRGTCVSRMCQEVVMISRFSVSAEEKTKYYNSIAESDFYKTRLQGRKFKCKGKYRIVFWLFEKKVYWALDFYGLFKNTRQHLHELCGKGKC